ncbi:threonine 3-dehydrogenase [Acrasis kona]|uniref:L-threonine 3-dehydrogenase, mitochondrial n=1 Tax=Acrasis kona TaxID=1008807 RepID=A0AAW2ZF36_9EUKA
MRISSYPVVSALLSHNPKTVLRHSLHTFNISNQQRLYAQALRNTTPGTNIKYQQSYPSTKQRVLITGCMGQIGVELIEALAARYGKGSVVCSDVSTPTKDNLDQFAPFYFCDVNDRERLQMIVDRENVTCIVHNAAFLSASAEQNVAAAVRLNTIGLFNVLEIAKRNHLRVFVPSSIAAFGPTTPLESTPNTTIQRPTTVYGIGKVYAELMGEYYALKHGVDYRSLRYPGILSYKTKPGGGTTDYAVHMFYYALQGEHYECYLQPDQKLPMMYMPDCIRGTMQFILDTKQEQLKERTYNIAAYSFSPIQLEQMIKKFIPSFSVSYRPDFRQGIAESWPRILEDDSARGDWGWGEEFNLEKTCRDMLVNLSKIIPNSVKLQNID